MKKSTLKDSSQLPVSSSQSSNARKDRRGTLVSYCSLAALPVFHRPETACPKLPPCRPASRRRAPHNRFQRSVQSAMASDGPHIRLSDRAPRQMQSTNRQCATPPPPAQPASDHCPTPPARE